MLGSTGLILGNCVNMAIRIGCSLKFIRDFFSTTPYHPLEHSVPSTKLLATFVITLLVTALSEVLLVRFSIIFVICTSRSIFAVGMAGYGG